MKPSKKAVSGKTMRVATTFTGAAACAFAFAPAAAAATAGTNQDAAPAGHQAPTMGHRQLAVDNTISKNHCPPGTSNWLHLAYLGNTGDRCFGFSGTKYLGYAPFSIGSYCGGNNVGTIWGYSHDGYQHGITFGPGTTYARVAGGNFLVTSVSIKYWVQGNNDKCGPPPH